MHQTIHRTVTRYAMRAVHAVQSVAFDREVQPAKRNDIRVECSVGRLRAVLGYEHFTNNWELSYHYRGEDVNMRRPFRRNDSYEWYQTHVRAFEADDGVYVEAHEDLEPTEWPYYHLNEPSDADTDGERAVETVCTVLDLYNIEYERHT